MAALANDFARAAAPVNPSLTSTTKWRPATRLVAEALHLADDDVYGATVSKAGNLSVRGVQSKGAVARVLVAFWTGKSEADFDSTVTAVRNHCTSRDLVLVARRTGELPDGSPYWSVEVVLCPPSSVVPSAISSAWPSITVLPLT
jgi:hypothetical protein